MDNASARVLFLGKTTSYMCFAVRNQPTVREIQPKIRFEHGEAKFVRLRSGEFGIILYRRE
jgi:hypothetical protein